MPANAVDWVLVELRDTNSPANATMATRIARKAGIHLTSDGSIVGTNGSMSFILYSFVIKLAFLQ